MGEVEWDPARNEQNIEKHGISLVAASRVFDDPDTFQEDTTRPEYGEKRMKAVGMVDERLMAVIYTDRDDFRRIISARRTRPNERRQYDQGQEAG